MFPNNTIVDQLAKVILITGGTGAGKTTYARRLAKDLSAVRFSIDEWMTTLFWMDSPDPISHDWALARIERAEAQIWDVAMQILSAGTSVILDLGLTTSDHRKKFQTLARNASYSVGLHWIDVPADLRWSRVQTRNREKGETFAMDVTRDMFDFMEGLWEAPTPQEWDSYDAPITERQLA